MATVEQVLWNHQAAINGDQDHPHEATVTKFANAEGVYRIDIHITKPEPVTDSHYEVDSADMATVINILLMEHIDPFSGWQIAATNPVPDPRLPADPQ